MKTVGGDYIFENSVKGPGPPYPLSGHAVDMQDVSTATIVRTVADEMAVAVSGSSHRSPAQPALSGQVSNFSHWSPMLRIPLDFILLFAACSGRSHFVCSRAPRPFPTSVPPSRTEREIRTVGVALPRKRGGHATAKLAVAV